MKLTLRQLHIFRAIAQLGSTTQASATLALSQSATSAALQELEGALDIRLFDRVGKRLVLNENGQALLPKAIRLLEAALEIEGGFRTDVVARLRVGCSTTIGNYIMPLLMQHMAERAGGTQIDVILGNSAEIARQAAQLSIDVGLVEGPSHQPTLAVQPWCEDELIIVAAADDLWHTRGGFRLVTCKKRAGWYAKRDRVRLKRFSAGFFHTWVPGAMPGRLAVQKLSSGWSRLASESVAFPIGWLEISSPRGA